jgi:hypothetical protein
VRIFVRNSEECLSNLDHIASVGDADRDAEPNAPVAIGPVSHRRVDEFRIRHDHHDVVVRANDCASRANLFHLAGNPRYFDAVPDGDRSLRQNHQTADEITGDVLQAEADAHADRSSENCQRSEMNPCVFQDKENANDQHDVADDLSNRVLERTIESTLSQQSIKKKAFRSRGDPENRNQKRDEQKNLKKT